MGVGGGGRRSRGVGWRSLRVYNNTSLGRNVFLVAVNARTFPFAATYHECVSTHFLCHEAFGILLRPF